jgi:hypothetical protein
MYTIEDLVISTECKTSKELLIIDSDTEKFKQKKGFR